MANFTFTVTLELADLDGGERAELAEEIGLDVHDLGDVNDVGAGDLADALEHAIASCQHEYIWPGSDMFATITNVSVVSA